MIKRIALIILIGIMVITSGCGVTHKTEISSESVITSIEDISESNGR